MAIYYIGQNIHGDVIIVDNFRELLLGLQEAGDVVFLDAKTSLLRVSCMGQLQSGQAFRQTSDAEIDDVIEGINRLGTVRIGRKKLCEPRNLAKLKMISGSSKNVRS